MELEAWRASQSQRQSDQQKDLKEKLKRDEERERQRREALLRRNRSLLESNARPHAGAPKHHVDPSDIEPPNRNRAFTRNEYERRWQADADRVARRAKCIKECDTAAKAQERRLRLEELAKTLAPSVDRDPSRVKRPTEAHQRRRAASLDHSGGDRVRGGAHSEPIPLGPRGVLVHHVRGAVPWCGPAHLL